MLYNSCDLDNNNWMLAAVHYALLQNLPFFGRCLNWSVCRQRKSVYHVTNESMWLCHKMTTETSRRIHMVTMLKKISSWNSKPNSTSNHASFPHFIYQATMEKNDFLKSRLIFCDLAVSWNIKMGGKILPSTLKSFLKILWNHMSMKTQKWFY